MNDTSARTGLTTLGQRTLIMLALCLLVSGRALWAQSGTIPAPKGRDMPDEATSASLDGPTSASMATDKRNSGNPDFPDLFESLKERERLLDVREEKLRRETQRLEAFKLDIDQKLKELEASRQSIEALYATANAARLKRLKKMVTSYEGMKPEQAAKVFEGLDNAEALSLLELMDTKKVAKIFDAMKSQRATELTKDLNKVVPKPEVSSPTLAQ
jgi:flagellar motility protein MotE (MotC chaperone)